jgi:hypothetical protein
MNDCLAVGAAGRLRLRWVNAAETLVTHFLNSTLNFVPTQFAAGRVVAGAGGISIDASPALTVVDGRLRVAEFVEGPARAASSPRVEFWLDKKLAGSLTAAGRLHVPAITELETLAPTGDRFEFREGGVLKAYLHAGGLVAIDVEEAG